MTIRPRPGRPLLASALALTIPLAGCFGPSDDKGDNGGSVLTPKPSVVQDANTAGSSKTALPVPPLPEASKAGEQAEPAPK